MIRTKLGKATTVLIAAGLIVASIAVQAGDLASGAQIKATLSGNTLQGGGSSGTYAEYYAPDGTIRGKDYTAKWRIEGDKGCMDYGSGFSCWTALIDGPAAIWYRDGKVDAVSMTVPGNPNKF